MEEAVSQINAYLDGNRNARIECDYEGELYGWEMGMFYLENGHAEIRGMLNLKEEFEV